MSRAPNCAPRQINRPFRHQDAWRWSERAPGSKRSSEGSYAQRAGRSLGGTPMSKSDRGAKAFGLSLNSLIALYLEHFRPGAHTLIFFASCIAIIPVAGFMGRATEQIADRFGEGHWRPAQCNLRQRSRIDHRNPPLLMFLSYVIAAGPMDLAFTMG